MTRIDPWHHALDRKTGCDDLAAGVQPGLTAILRGRMAVGDQAQITEVMLDKAEHPPRHGIFSSTPSSNHSRHSSPRCDLKPDARRRAREDHLPAARVAHFRRLGASQRNHMILQSGTHSGSTILEKRHSQTKRQPALYGGEGGIRTHGTVTRTTVFETAPIDHSGTSPQRWSEGPWSRPPVDRGGPLTQGSLLAKRSLACPRYFPTLPV